MSLTADIQYTVLKPDQVYTNTLTPVSALPWNQQGDERIFPVIPNEFESDHLIWDFGDGTTYTGVSAEHTYTWPGDYTITLTMISSTGEPIISTNTVPVNVKDMLPTQFGYNNLKDTIDIPAGRVGNEIQLTFYMSWQNYTLLNQNDTTCSDGKRHWMNNGTGPGKWMCGSEHQGETDAPVYTFSLYASGSNAEPVNLSTYSKEKYSHLNSSWSFRSSESEISSIPLNEITVTLLDSLTGSTGDPNTYELVYYGYIDNEFQPVQPTAPGATLVGLSGNVSYYYVDNIPKCKNSNDTPVTVSVQMDSTKLMDSYIYKGSDAPIAKSLNIPPTIISNVKPRSNRPDHISITCNGLNEFQINSNKWTESELSFTVTVQDELNFNILDTSVIDETNLNIYVTDASGTIVDPSTYTITPVVNTEPGYYRGTINFSTSAENVSIDGDYTYNPTSGYLMDATVAWMNSYSSSDSYGEMYRSYYIENHIHDSESLSDNTTVEIIRQSANVKTSGIISDVPLASAGSGMVKPPKITVDGSGIGAALSADYDVVTNQVTDITVLSGGQGYESASTTFTFETFPQAATAPTIGTVQYENNYQTSLVAVSVETADERPYSWSLETGSTPRLVKTSTNEYVQTYPLTDYDAFTTGAKAIKLDSDKNVWIVTDNRVMQVDNDTLVTSITGSFACLDIDKQDNIYCTSTNSIQKRLSTDYSTVADTATLSNSINDIIYLYNDTIWCLLNTGVINVLDSTLSITKTINLPAGTYSNQLTTTIDNNVYIISDTGTLYSIDSDGNITAIYIIPNTPTIRAIAGDSRGYIWVSDSANKLVYTIDVSTTAPTVNTTLDTLKPGHVNKFNYPTGFASDHVLQATGDFTGFHWLQKYGYVSSDTVTLTGSSAAINIYDKQGRYHIRKQGENHDHKEMLKSYALQPWLKDNYNLWENMISPAVGDINSSPTQIGKYIHEKVSNFVANNNDIDDCNIDALLSYTHIYDVPIQTYNINFPPSLKRLIDLLSIKHKRLYGELDNQTDNFDQFTDYTNTLRENLGDEIDINTHVLTVGDTIVAYEKFSKVYSKISVSEPLSGNIDTYGNIVDAGTDTNALTGAKFNFKNYNYFWNWGLTAPSTVTGGEIVNYYNFYMYNPTVTPPQVEGVVNFNDPQNNIDQTDTAYSSWVDGNQIADNIIEHQLRVGLGLI